MPLHKPSQRGGFFLCKDLPKMEGLPSLRVKKEGGMLFGARKTQYASLFNQILTDLVYFFNQLAALVYNLYFRTKIFTT
jgi:hypothetical protein